MDYDFVSWALWWCVVETYDKLSMPPRSGAARWRGESGCRGKKSGKATNS
jgi:hypothetical protein